MAVGLTQSLTEVSTSGISGGGGGGGVKAAGAKGLYFVNNNKLEP
jgi:hypothetical protein